MKHLKRIFESTEELDTDYIEMCFVDFIDQGCEIEVDTDEDGRKYIELLPDLPGIELKNGKFINSNKSETLDDVLKSSKELYDFYDAIDNNPFDAYLHLLFMLPKNIKRVPLEKGKLGTVNFSDLDDTWDVRSEDEN